MEDTTEVFCPHCGEKVLCALVYKDTLADITGYKGHCTECDKDIEVEDRSSFEQEGIVVVEFR